MIMRASGAGVIATVEVSERRERRLALLISNDTELSLHFPAVGEKALAVLIMTPGTADAHTEKGIVKVT